MCAATWSPGRCDSSPTARSTGRASRGSPLASDTPPANSSGCCRPRSGPNPLALARAQRTQTARVLIETTELPFSDVAFAAGFSQHPPVQRHGAGGMRPDSDGSAPAGAFKVRPRRSAVPERCRCGCRCVRRSHMKGCSAIWLPALCRASRKCVTARTDGRCGSPMGTESSVSHHYPIMCSASSCWTTSAISPRRSRDADACSTSMPTPRRSSTRSAPTQT